MQEYNEFFTKAKKEFDLADHIIYITYPIVKDKILFLSAVTHLTNAAVNAIDFFLNREKSYKKILMLPASAKLKVRFFAENYSQMYTVHSEFWKDILDMIEFTESRPEKVQLEKDERICVLNENYKILRFDMDKIKRNLVSVKNIITKIGSNIQ